MRDGPGPIDVSCGDVSVTVAATANLASGANDCFVLNVWYDALSGTFA